MWDPEEDNLTRRLRETPSLAAYVDAAAETQRQSGGTFDTCLLEAGAPEPLVVPALVLASGLEGFAHDLLAQVDVTLATRLPKPLAEVLALAPVAVTAESLVLIGYEPWPASLLQRLAAVIGTQVSLRIAPAVRVLDLTARLYGLPLAPRYIALRTRLDEVLVSARAQKRREELKRVLLALGTTHQELRACVTRDDVLQCLVQSGGLLGHTCFFVVQKEGLRLWPGSAVTLPDDTEPLAQALRTRKLHVAKRAPTDLAELALDQALRGAYVVVLPVVAKERVRALLYIETEAPPDTEVQQALEELAAVAAEALSRVARAAPAPAPPPASLPAPALPVSAHVSTVSALCQSALSPDERVRIPALQALRAHGGAPEVGALVAELRQRLKTAVGAQQLLLVTTLTELRDPRAVPSLIPLVAAPEEAVAKAAAHGLELLCAQDHGGKVERWVSWWQAHFNQARQSWLIESLVHANPATVAVARQELTLLTEVVGSPPQLIEQKPDIWWEQTRGHIRVGGSVKR